MSDYRRRVGGVGTVQTAYPVALVALVENFVEVRVSAACELVDLEVVLATIVGATACTVAIYRDALGTIPLVGKGPSGAVQTLTNNAGNGGAVWPVPKEHNVTADSVTGAGDTWPEGTYATLWVGLTLNGTADVMRLVLNWRA